MKFCAIPCNRNGYLAILKNLKTAEQQIQLLSDFHQKLIDINLSQDQLYAMFHEVLHISF